MKKSERMVWVITIAIFLGAVAGIFDFVLRRSRAREIGTTKKVLKKPDLQQLFLLNGLKGLCAPGG